MENLKRTPFYELHQEMGGRMVPFAGYLMPVQFSGIKDEHLAVRTAIGLFDVSHMGEIFIRGKDALRFCQKATTNDASRLAPGKIQYSLLGNERGGIIDDVLLYQLSDTEYFFCVNASNRDKDFRWLKSCKQSEDVLITDESDAYCQLAIQGPRTKDLLKTWIGLDLDTLAYYHFQTVAIDKTEIIVSKTGYTGEDGVELYFKNAADQKSIALARKLLKLGEPLGIKPCGLGCRDTLRMEMGYSLYGHEIDENTNPFEAGLAWVVKLNKPSDFIGKAALASLKNQGIKKTTVGILADSPQPIRDKLDVYYKDGTMLGTTTSGSYSPVLKKGFGLARLRIDLPDGTTISEHLNQRPPRLHVDIRGKRCPVIAIKPPFVGMKKDANKN